MALTIIDANVVLDVYDHDVSDLKEGFNSILTRLSALGV